MGIQSIIWNLNYKIDFLKRIIKNSDLLERIVHIIMEELKEMKILINDLVKVLNEDRDY